MENHMTVDGNQPQSAPVDAVLATATAQDNTIALSEALAGDAGSAGAAENAAPLGSQDAGQAQEAQDVKVDKGFQGRVNAQVQKAVAQEVAGIRSQYETQLASLREMTFSREADALVAGGKFGDRDVALEYLQLKYGGTAPQAPQQATQAAPQAERARDGQGRFVAAQAADPAGDARVQTLMQQAAAIQAAGGPDMRQVMREDEIIGTMVSSGKWDFNRAAEEWWAKQAGQPRQGVPPTVRGANHTNTRKSFKDMTDQEFEAFNRRLENGERFDARR